MSAIWMKVTKDKYEFLIVVADSFKELAKMCNTTKSAIYTQVCMRRTKNRKTEFVKVELGEEV